MDLMLAENLIGDSYILLLYSDDKTISCAF